MIVYKILKDPVYATIIAEKLREEGIECELQDITPPFDVTMTGNPMEKEVQVQIRQEDFERADAVFAREAEREMEDLNPDYYLFTFSDKELFEVLMKPDEWNAFDYTLAQKLLKERGREVDEALLKSLRDQRIEELARPEEGQRPWIMAGYIFAMLGGIIGLLIGLYLNSYKKTLPNGAVVYGFKEEDRRHGRRIIVISLVIIPIAVVFRVLAGR